MELLRSWIDDAEEDAALQLALQDLSIGGGNGASWLGTNGDDFTFTGNEDTEGHAGYGNDFVYGSSGDDVLFGNAGDDFLYGGGGTDALNGGPGNDLLSGGASNDTITDSDGSDSIDGGAGDDAITDSGSGTNVLRGGDGNDTVKFSNYANNTIEGGVGNDLLQVADLNFTGAAYANTLTGGTGNDRMAGGSSADTYVFNRGDGQDVILDWNNYASLTTDKLVFGAGIVQSNLVIAKSGNHLLVKVSVSDPTNAAATDQITIENWFNGTTYYRIENFAFADGTSLNSTNDPWNIWPV